MLITKENTAVLFVDLQERLVPAMNEGEEAIRRSAILSEGAKAMNVPRVFVRQYPKGLGDIAQGLRETMDDLVPFDKIDYSAVKDEAILEKLTELKEQGIENILTCGMESHVCVLQTCIDLVEEGFQPFMVADCSASRTVFDKEIGMRRAMQEGVLLTTVESALFELCAKAGTDEFKAISKLVK